MHGRSIDGQGQQAGKHSFVVGWMTACLQLLGSEADCLKGHVGFGVVTFVRVDEKGQAPVALPVTPLWDGGEWWSNVSRQWRCPTCMLATVFNRSSARLMQPTPTNHPKPPTQPPTQLHKTRGKFPNYKKHQQNTRAAYLISARATSRVTPKTP